MLDLARFNTNIVHANNRQISFEHFLWLCDLFLWSELLFIVFILRFIMYVLNLYVDNFRFWLGLRECFIILFGVGLSISHHKIDFGNLSLLFFIFGFFSLSVLHYVINFRNLDFLFFKLLIISLWRIILSLHVYLRTDWFILWTYLNLRVTFINLSDGGFHDRVCLWSIFNCGLFNFEFNNFKISLGLILFLIFFVNYFNIG